MYYLLFAVHLLIAFLICVVVLLQRSKGGGLSGAFGGVGAGDAAFGGLGVTTFLHKATIYLAIGFMVTSLGLAYLTASRSTHTRGPARASSRGEIVLPVAGSQNVPEVPDMTTPTGAGDVVPSDSSAVVPGVGDIVPTVVDSTAASGGAGGATGGGEDTGGGDGGGR